VRSIQTNHAWIAEHANHYNEMLKMPNIQEKWDLYTNSGLAALNAEITRQAQMIAYLNVFKLLMVITLALIPLLLLLRDSRRPKNAEPAPVALD